uniref:Uncharacterized protein n=1 Tax=Leersia perrieri TaxID=77586 RepID=A0A0D9XII8_9ORYZ
MRLLRTRADVAIVRVDKYHDPSGDCIRYVVISEKPATPLPDGTPAWEVTISNVCPRCKVAAIDLNCGNFSSDRPLDPHVFSLVVPGDCLVNYGDPIGPTMNLSFVYYNRVHFDLLVKNAYCLE